MDDNENIHVHGSSATGDSPFMTSVARAVRPRSGSSKSVVKKHGAPALRAAALASEPPLHALGEYTRLARGREAELVQQIAELRQELLALALEAEPVQSELEQLRVELGRGEHPIGNLLDIRGLPAAPEPGAFVALCAEVAQLRVRSARRGVARRASGCGCSWQRRRWASWP
jgi:hypothetical protein